MHRNPNAITAALPLGLLALTTPLLGAASGEFAPYLPLVLKAPSLRMTVRFTPARASW